MSDIAEQKALDEVQRVLVSEFPGAAPDTVAQAIWQALAPFETSRIRDFVPLFVEKHARAWLTASGALAASA